MKAFVFFAFCAALGSCASAGPVVSNISYEATGSLAIEKCMVHTNFFFGTMQLTECFVHHLTITVPPRTHPPGTIILTPGTNTRSQNGADPFQDDSAVK